MEICKNYKPEILTCPICSSKLVYRYTMSNKHIYFTSGKKIRIKNLGYSCPKCNNQIYVSQTANKLCFKGYTYSAKIVCLIAKFKQQNKSREFICDYFFSKNIEISDRNVDNLYNKYLEYANLDYKTTIEASYEQMLKKFNQIRLSIDLITIQNSIFVLVYDYFSTNLLALKQFDTINDPNIKLFLADFLNKDLNITVIASIRKDSIFIPMLKNLCPVKTKFIAFQKF